jgi:hypothetical protein
VQLGEGNVLQDLAVVLALEGLEHLISHPMAAGMR